MPSEIIADLSYATVYTCSYLTTIRPIHVGLHYIRAGLTAAQNLAIGQLTMQQLQILQYTFRFTTAQIVINGTLKYALYYITFSLTCGLRTVYLINLKNLICVDLVKCRVKFCLYLIFYTDF